MHLLSLVAAVQFTFGLSPVLERYDFGEESFEYYGSAVVDVGDWDGDGVGDYAVGSPGEAVAGVEGHGRVRVFSGVSSDQIAQSEGLFTAADAEVGFAIAGGFDSDEDGVPELAVGVPGLGEVLIVELGTGSFGAQLLVRERIFAIDSPTVELREFGRTVVNVGDVTGDDLPDLAVGAPESNQVNGEELIAGKVGAVRLYSGSDFVALATFTDGEPGQRFGTSIASVRDMNSDGIRDLLIGGPGITAPSQKTLGRAYFFDATGSSPAWLLGSLTDGSPGSGFGLSVADAGDITGGTRSEFLVGAMTTLSFAEITGQLTLFEGNTFQPLWRRGEPGAGINPSDIALADLDGDEIREVVSMEMRTEKALPAIVTLDLLTGETENSFGVWSLSDTADWSVAVEANFDGDGRPELIAGLPTLEHWSGAVVAWDLFENPPLFGPPVTWTVDDDDPSADFAGLSQALLVADSNDVVELFPGSYAAAGTMRSATILGQPDAGGALPFVNTLRAVGMFSFWMQDVDALRVDVGATDGRITLEGVVVGQLRATKCSDVTVGNSTLGPFGPGVHASASRIELRSCEVHGSEASGPQSPGSAGMLVENGSDVLLADFLVFGGDGVAGGSFGDQGGGPGVSLQSGSTLRTRGWPDDMILGGFDPFEFSLKQPGIQTEPGTTVLYSQSHDFPVIIGGGEVLGSLSAKPWLEYDADPKIFSAWPLTYHDDAGLLGAIYLTFAPAALEIPQVVGTPVWIDAGSIYAAEVVVAGGLNPLPSVTFQIPPVAALVGLQLHVQGFSLASSVVEGTNGGAVRIR